MIEHEAIEIRVKRLEVLRVVHRMEVVDVRCNLHLATQSVLDNAAEWVAGCPLGKRELIVTVGHALRADEDEIDESAREEMRQLKPYFPRKRRLRPSSKDEYTDGGRLQT